MDPLPPQNPDGERKHREIARDILRKWIQLDEAALRSAPTFLGQGIIRAAADTSARLARYDEDTGAEALLTEFLRSVTVLDDAPATRSRWWERNRSPVAPTSPDTASLVERLERQCDSLDRLLVTLRGDKRRLGEAADSLENFQEMLVALDAVVKSGAREIAPEDPRRASLLREIVLSALLE